MLETIKSYFTSKEEKTQNQENVSNDSNKCESCNNSATECKTECVAAKKENTHTCEEGCEH
jgi:hypothetical protein